VNKKFGDLIFRKISAFIPTLPRDEGTFELKEYDKRVFYIYLSYYTPLTQTLNDPYSPKGLKL